MALQGGIPIAIFERRGQVLRVFEQDSLKEALHLFAESYKRGKIFTDKKRILVKEYPKEIAPLLEGCGFGREVSGYALYR